MPLIILQFSKIVFEIFQNYQAANKGLLLNKLRLSPESFIRDAFVYYIKIGYKPTVV